MHASYSNNSTTSTSAAKAYSGGEKTSTHRQFRLSSTAPTAIRRTTPAFTSLHIPQSKSNNLCCCLSSPLFVVVVVVVVALLLALHSKARRAATAKSDDCKQPSVVASVCRVCRVCVFSVRVWLALCDEPTEKPTPSSTERHRLPTFFREICPLDPNRNEASIRGTPKTLDYVFCSCVCFFFAFFFFIRVCVCALRPRCVVRCDDKTPPQSDPPSQRRFVRRRHHRQRRCRPPTRCRSHSPRRRLRPTFRVRSTTTSGPARMSSRQHHNGYGGSAPIDASGSSGGGGGGGGSTTQTLDKVHHHQQNGIGADNQHQSRQNGHFVQSLVAVPEMCAYCFDVLDGELGGKGVQRTPSFTDKE